MEGNVQGNYEVLDTVLQNLKDKDQYEPLIWYFRYKKEQAFNEILNKGDIITPEQIYTLRAELQIYDELINIKKRVGEVLKSEYNKRGKKRFKISF